MNYYPHHIGDYAAATAHLSPLEDCFYRRMLDRYYQTEQALPADEQKLFRVLRATTKGDKNAVRSVSREFFETSADGLRQRRCDEEILDFRATAERSRINGALGGRPKKKPGESKEAKTQRVISGIEAGNPDETQKKANQNQNQNQEKRKDIAPAALTVSDLLADGLDEKLAAEYLAHRKRKNALLTPTAWKGVKAQAVIAGVTPSVAVAKCIERGWTGFDATWLASPSGPNQASRRTTPTSAEHEAAGSTW